MTSENSLNNLHTIFLGLLPEYAQEPHHQSLTRRAQEEIGWDEFFQTNSELIDQILQILGSEEWNEVKEIRDSFTAKLFSVLRSRTEAVAHAEKYAQDNRLEERNSRLWAELDPLLERAVEKMKEVGMDTERLIR